jgi:predicted Ser/Thr protein kinase
MRAQLRTALYPPSQKLVLDAALSLSINSTTLLEPTIEVNKISVRVFRPLDATEEIFWICVGVLRDNGTASIYQLRYLIGNDTVPFLEVEHPSDERYEPYVDMDLVDGVDECRTVLLNDDGYQVFGPGLWAKSVDNFPADLRIEAASIDQISVSVFAIGDGFGIRPLAPLFPNGLPGYFYSMEARVVNSAGPTIALAACKGSNDPVLVYFTNDGHTVNSTSNGVFPSLIDWPDGSILTCAVTDPGLPGKDVFCFDELGEEVTTLPGVSGLKITTPRLARLNTDLGTLSLLVEDSNFAPVQSRYELRALTKSGVITANTLSRSNVVRTVSHSAMNNYAFVGYLDATSGVHLDVVRYADVDPPVSTNPDVSPAPINPSPDQSPVPPPAASPSAEVVDDPPVVAVEVVVPAVVVSVGAAAVGLFLLLFLLKRRQKQNKKGKNNDNEDKGQMLTVYGNISNGDSTPVTGRTTRENYNVVPTTGNSTGYSIMPDSTHPAPSMAGVKPDEDILNPYAIKSTEIEKRMHIPYSSLAFVKELGAGSYGKVYLGEWRGAEVAIKVNNAISDTDGFLAEAKLTLGMSPHPNLVQTFGVSLDGPSPCIVLEFCGGGSLDTSIFNGATITDAKRKELALKIAYGLLHLHNNNIVHRDLAARNILLTAEGQPKISDFGMSRIVKDDATQGKTKSLVGPLRWMAPESLKSQAYSVKSDVWSYGILVWEIAAGSEPHMEEDQLVVIVKIRDSGFTPAIPPNCDPALKEVMEMCWQLDPNNRPTMEDVVARLRAK